MGLSIILQKFDLRFEFHLQNTRAFQREDLAVDLEHVSDLAVDFELQVFRLADLRRRGDLQGGLGEVGEALEGDYFKHFVLLANHPSAAARTVQDRGCIATRQEDPRNGSSYSEQ